MGLFTTKPVEDLIAASQAGPLRRGLGPVQLSAAAGTIVARGDARVAAVFNVPAVVISVLVTWLLVRGVKESAMVNSIIVFVKVAIILLVIAAGAAFIRPANYTPFVPPN